MEVKGRTSQAGVSSHHSIGKEWARVCARLCSHRKVHEAGCGGWQSLRDWKNPEHLLSVTLRRTSLA